MGSLHLLFVAFVGSLVEAVATGATKSAFDKGIIVEMYAGMKTFTIDFIDAVEIRGCNFIRALFDGTEFVIHFVNMTISDWGHITTQLEECIPSVKGAFDEMSLAGLVDIGED